MRTQERLAEREVEDLVRAHLPLVGHLVAELLRRLPAHVQRDDLVSAGMAALAAAARSYDPDRGVAFSTFATNRVRGALLDELRGLDWASRSVRSQARRVEEARQRLTAALGRAPTSAELADALGMAVADLAAVDEAVQRATVLSLQGFPAGTADDLVTERTPGPEDLLLHREKVGYLHNAVQALPARLNAVVTGYFLHERPMTAIAAELGVTESRVSQLRAEALRLLRDGLNTHLDDVPVSTTDRPAGAAARRRGGLLPADRQQRHAGEPARPHQPSRDAVLALRPAPLTPGTNWGVGPPPRSLMSPIVKRR